MSRRLLQKQLEVGKLQEEQRIILEKRARFGNSGLHTVEKRRLLDQLKDPVLYTKYRERASAVGYIMNYQVGRSISAAEIPRSSISAADVNTLIEVSFNEAQVLCKDIIRLCVFNDFPIQLRSLDTCGLGKKKSMAKTVGGEEDDKDEDTLESEIEDKDTDGNDVEIERGEKESDPGSEVIERQLGGMAYLTSTAARDAARMDGLTSDYDAAVTEVSQFMESLSLSDTSGSSSTVSNKNILSQVHDPSPSPTPTAVVEYRKLLNSQGKITVRAMLDYWQGLQSGPTTKSERIIVVNPKFFKNVTEVREKAKDTPEVPKISVKEASHRIHVAQDLSTPLNQGAQRKTREMCWKGVVQSFVEIMGPNILVNLNNRNVTSLLPLKPGSHVIMRTEVRMYISKVLDLFKKSVSSRYPSVKESKDVSQLAYLSLQVSLQLNYDGDDEEEEPVSSPMVGKSHIFTHAPVENMLYHLGPGSLTFPKSSDQLSLRLTEASLNQWSALRKSKAQQCLKQLPVLKIKIPRKTSIPTKPTT
ncbi:hypothetical protein AAF712_016704 [Marasmius tenuissimus]|uniref:Uncharacterized protein n=1 Tax=Marasmius tenuissimus TaxID=585030 RepID=A0ABR2Z626_9AGAR